MLGSEEEGVLVLRTECLEERQKQELMASTLGGAWPELVRSASRFADFLLYLSVLLGVKALRLGYLWDIYAVQTVDGNLWGAVSGDGIKPNLCLPHLGAQES